MSNAGKEYQLDPRQTRRAFDRAASGFDAAAVLHTQVRTDLLGRLDLISLQPAVAIDVGTGTGHGAKALIRRYPKARVIAIDSSLQMLRGAARQQTWLRRFERVCAAAERLPLADASVQLIVSNLMLQWCDLDLVLAEFARVLAPEGLLSFTTLGPDTLHELRSAWAMADEQIHVHRFIDMHEVGDALVRAGFAAPVLDVERYTLQYQDARKVAADLKATGAHNAALGRPRGLTGKRRSAAWQDAYEAFRLEGRLPATYEIVFGHAWAPAQRREGSQTSLSLEEVKRQLRTPRP